MEGLTEVQGFLFSPPVPLDEIREILAKAEKAVFAA
jgi:EAL domain-containing protein (putative c-di-GMP-specific phosphodiesterase class I)